MKKNTSDYISDNTLYAPGLSTYSIQGKTGKTGSRGYSLFYTQYDIETSKDIVMAKIQNNLSLYNNEPVEYKPNDLIIDCTGNLYVLTEDTDIKKIGNIRSYPKIGFTIISNTLNIIPEYADIYEFDLLSSTGSVYKMNVPDGTSINPSNSIIISYVRIRDKKTGEMTTIRIK